MSAKKNRRRVQQIYRRRRHPLKALWYWAEKPDDWDREAKRWLAARKFAKRRVADAAAAGRKAKANAWRLKRREYAKQYKRAERKAEKQGHVKVVVEPGPPHWGGSDDQLELKAEPIVKRETGLHPNSAKRHPCYGFCGSDHHDSQIWASARDWAIAGAYWLAQILRDAFAPGMHREYAYFYWEEAGQLYRGQLIASNHGTGPHLHFGIRWMRVA